MTDHSLSRREMLETTAAALASVPLLTVGCKAPAVGSRAAGFFSAAELALVDELSDIIIPTDGQSPGARAAGVAAYLDARLAESLESDHQASWRTGIQAVDALSREMNGKGFMEATPEQRLAAVTSMAAGEADPKTPAQQFFKEIKGATMGAYYTSKIGIQIDQQYKGNVYQPGEYAGYDPQ